VVSLLLADFFADTGGVDLPGDFADLTLVTLSERLDVAEILSLDSDFDVYRGFRKQSFQRVELNCSFAFQ
jgi:hypothetical protein